MANLLLESGDNGKPGFWRELAAAVISPPTGVNRLGFGNRFDEVYPSQNPATFLRLQVGGMLTSSNQNVSSSIKEAGSYRGRYVYLRAGWDAPVSVSGSLTPSEGSFRNVSLTGELTGPRTGKSGSFQ